jgi:hypothetical protein
MAEHKTPLLSDTDIEKSGSFEHDDGKRDLNDDEEIVEFLSDTVTLPEYKPETAHHESAAPLLAKGDHYRAQENEAAQDDGEGDSKCSRRGCFGRRCRRRCRRASGMSDEKRRVRRRIAFFVKGFMLLGLLSYFIAKMCLRHMRVSVYPTPLL